MIETESVELMMTNTELILKYVDDDLLIDRIKSRAKIEYYERGNETMVSRTHDVVVKNRDGGFCGGVLSMGRFRKKTVLSRVVTYTINNKTLDYLRDEAQICVESVRSYVVQLSDGYIIRGRAIACLCE